MQNSPDKMSVPESNEGAKKKLDSIKQWGKDLDYDLSGAGNFIESLNQLSIYGFFDKKTSDLLETFLERDNKGFNVDIDGETLQYKDLGKAVDGLNQVIYWWVLRIKSGEISDPKETLRDAIDRWKTMVVPKINEVKKQLMKAAKIQAYCGKPGYEKIRDELDKKYGLAKFEELLRNSKVIGFVIVQEDLQKFRQKLDDGLYDLLNPDFADTLPDLLSNGQLDIPKMFDKEPFTSMIDRLPKDIGLIIKKIAVTGSKSPKNVDKKIQKMFGDIVPYIDKAMSEYRKSPEYRARVQDAKDNLINHGFEIDEKNGIIIDPDGYEIFNSGGDKERFMDAGHDLSALIDNRGYHEAMDIIRTRIRKQIASGGEE